MREERRDGERGEGTRGEKMGGGSESVLKLMSLDLKFRSPSEAGSFQATTQEYRTLLEEPQGMLSAS